MNSLSGENDFTVPKSNNNNSGAPIQAPDLKNGKDFTQSDYEDYLNDVQANIKKMEFSEEESE